LKKNIVSFSESLIGYEKPHPKAYLAVLNYFKVKPEEAIFVWHDKEEMEGARKLGIRTISLSSLKRLKNLN
jgi:HAD superfamily hydrolase (TIGR01509 family)